MTNWIPIEDRLPAPNERVLASIGGAFVEDAELGEQGHWWRWNQDVGGPLLNVTHWQSWPQPARIE